MLELRFIRENFDLVKTKTAKRGLSTDILDRFTEVDTRRLTILGEVESLKNRRNTVSKEIADRYHIPWYAHQRINLVEKNIDSLFSSDRIRKTKLTDFF